MNTTTFMKGRIAAAAKEEDNGAFLEIYNEDAKRFDKKLLQQWCDYYARLSHGRSVRAIAERCPCSMNTVKKWSIAIPYHRNHFVMIGCCFGLCTDEVSFLMSRYGGFSKLRYDNLEDIMYIRLLELMREQTSDYTIDAFTIDSTYSIREGMYSAEISRIQSCGLWTMGRSQMARDSLLKGKYEDPALYERINSSVKYLRNSYHDVSEFLVKYRKNIGYSTNSQFYEKTGMTTSMQRIFSGMTTEVTRKTGQKEMTLKPMPWRRQIIAFCLYLGMPLDDINKTLCKANMEDLCPRDPFEAALLFILHQLYNKDERFGSRAMRGKDNLTAQNDLNYLYNNEYSGLFGYVYSRLSAGDFALFLKKMDVNLAYKMCI